MWWNPTEMKDIERERDFYCQQCKPVAIRKEWSSYGG